MPLAPNYEAQSFEANSHSCLGYFTKYDILPQLMALTKDSQEIKNQTQGFGTIAVSLKWRCPSDLDLHVF